MSCLQNFACMHDMIDLLSIGIRPAACCGGLARAKAGTAWGNTRVILCVLRRYRSFFAHARQHESHNVWLLSSVHTASGAALNRTVPRSMSRHFRRNMPQDRKTNGTSPIAHVVKFACDARNDAITSLHKTHFVVNTVASLAHIVNKATCAPAHWPRIFKYKYKYTSMAPAAISRTCYYRRPFSCIRLSYISIRLQYATRAASRVALRCVAAPNPVWTRLYMHRDPQKI